jgi:hypothetical protein
MEIKSLEVMVFVPEKHAAANWLEAKFDIAAGRDDMMTKK